MSGEEGRGRTADGDTPTVGMTETEIDALAVHPRHIGPYLIVRTLGSGGMGTVYLAEQSRPIARQVAIKLIRWGAAGPRTLQRFLAEREALARLRHPHIAQVLEAGATESGQPYVVLEYVPGSSIVLDADHHRLGLEARIHLLLQVCDAVSHAHRRGILHRDLKPANILVARDGERAIPKVIDFGIAKALDGSLGSTTLVTDGEMLGTPAYMSPEAIGRNAGGDIDTRTDVYALGVLLYELLSGVWPFASRPTPSHEVIRQILCEPAPSPSRRLAGLEGEALAQHAAARGLDSTALIRRLHNELDWITLKAIAPERERRYRSVDALAADLRRYLDRLPVAAGPPGRVYRIRRWVGRHRAAVIGGVLALLSLTTGVIATSVSALRARQEAARAGREAAVAEQVSTFLAALFDVADPGEVRGNTVTAREMLDRGVVTIGTRLADQPRVQARLLDTMGDAYRRLGLLPRAHALHRRALDLGRQLGDPLVMARSANGLGESLREDQRPEEAEPHLRRALAWRQGALEPDDPRIAESRNNLGVCLWQQDRFDEARALLEDALAIREIALGPRSHDVAVTLHNLGLVHGDADRPTEAEATLRASLSIKAETVGALHPSYANTLTSLAFRVREQGDLSAAEPLFREALATRETVHGDDHPRVGSARADLASLLHDLGRYDEAEPLYRQALEIVVAAHGDDHYDAAVARNNLATLLHERGALDEAERLFRRALEGRIQHRGERHPATARGWRNLASLMVDRGDLASAEQQTRRVLAIVRAARPDDHVDVGSAWSRLAEVLLLRADLAAAESASEEALARLRPQAASRPGAWAEARAVAAGVHLAHGRRDLAVTLLEEAVRTFEQRYAAGYPPAVRARHRLAAARATP